MLKCYTEITQGSYLCYSEKKNVYATKIYIFKSYIQIKLNVNFKLQIQPIPEFGLALKSFKREWNLEKKRRFVTLCNLWNKLDNLTHTKKCKFAHSTRHLLFCASALDWESCNSCICAKRDSCSRLLFCCCSAIASSAFCRAQISALSKAFCASASFVAADLWSSPISLNFKNLFKA